MSDQTQFDLPLPLPLPPPLAPTLVLGKFDYIKDISYKNRLVNAFQAITQTETWGFFATPLCFQKTLSFQSLVIK
jgi:hypothetical protein